MASTWKLFKTAQTVFPVCDCRPADFSRRNSELTRTNGLRCDVVCRRHLCVWRVLLFFKYFHTKYRLSTQRGARITAPDRRKRRYPTTPTSNTSRQKPRKGKCIVICSTDELRQPSPDFLICRIFKWTNFKTNMSELDVLIFFLRPDTDVLSFSFLMSARIVLIVFEFYIHEPNMMSY